MSIQSITYNEIITLAQNFALNNCRNISGSSYNSLEPCFKPGYSIRQRIFPGADNAGIFFNSSIIRACPSITSTQITNDISSFAFIVLNGIGASSICPPECFLGFVNNLVAFLAHRLFYTISQYSSNRHLIYMITDTASSPYFSLKTSNVPLVMAYEVNSINSCLTNLTNMEIRNYPCLYSASIT